MTLEAWAKDIIQGNPREDLDTALELAAEFDVGVEIVLTDGKDAASVLKVTVRHPYRDLALILTTAVDTTRVANFITTTLWTWDRRDYV